MDITAADEVISLDYTYSRTNPGSGSGGANFRDRIFVSSPLETLQSNDAVGNGTINREWDGSTTKTTIQIYIQSIWGSNVGSLGLSTFTIRGYGTNPFE
jgi:hypothetical protein